MYDKRYKQGLCTITKQESQKHKSTIIIQKPHSSFLLLFFCLRLTQHSGNLVEVTVLLIA